MNKNSVFRRLILFGAPLFAGLVLLFHPVGGISQPGQTLDVFGFIAPVADRFVIVHILFAPALGLLGLAMYFLLSGLGGRAAAVSRAATAIFVVFYVVYESIIGAATGNLVRTSLGLPTEQQAVIADAASKLWHDPVIGDFPALIPGIAFVAWAIAVVAAAVALRQMGAPLLACLLFFFSTALIEHVPPFGPAAMLCFLLAALWVERARAKIAGEARALSSAKAAA